jgi:hypothetical protein
MCHWFGRWLVQRQVLVTFKLVGGGGRRFFEPGFPTKATLHSMTHKFSGTHYIWRLNVVMFGVIRSDVSITLKLLFWPKVIFEYKN